jgi:TonB family protein
LQDKGSVKPCDAAPYLGQAKLMADQALNPTPNDPDIHLARLYTTGLQDPWLMLFFRNMREALRPDKKPPLVLTSKPIAVEGTDLQEAWVKVFIRDLKEAIHPKALPPLELTSKPIAVDTPDLEEPWLKTFVRNINEAIHPKKLPPLEVTSKPVEVKDMWGFYGGHERTAGMTSLLIHGGAIGLLFLIAMIPAATKVAKKQDVTLIAPDIAPYMPKAPAKGQTMGGGGGGGDRSPLPPSKGKLPRVAQRQFVPPTAVIQNMNPKLVMEPTIVAPPDVLPQVNMPNYGDPLAKLGPASNGPGSGGGIGTGSGGGVGSGHGQGFGPGSGGGVGGGVYRIGGGVSAPQLVFKVEPEYSEEARKAKFQGTVVLYVVVDANGNPRDLKVVRPLGLGLDQKAIEAVQKWRFKPGLKDGRPVAVSAQIEVNFRLL